MRQVEIAWKGDGLVPMMGEEVVRQIKVFRNKAKETNEHTKDLLLLESSSEQSSLFEETEDESSRVEKSERQTLLVGQ